jgi:hypothetical protein
MKATRILVVFVFTLIVAASAWIWQTRFHKNQGNSNQVHITTEEIAGETSGPAEESSSAQQPKEDPFSMGFRPDFGSDTTGSITLYGFSDGFNMMFVTERPGDNLIMSLGGMFGGGGQGMQTMIGTGEGSEIRFIGRFRTDYGLIRGERDTRLAFRKVFGGWRYVSGRGEYKEEYKVIRLGHNRTVDSCLDLLNSEDPIFREGAARDLGRLCTDKDYDRVVPQLAAMLRDSSIHIRRGAIEGLGLIGTSEATVLLLAAYEEETDHTTKGYFEEALGFCAAYSIMNEQDAPAEPPAVGLERLLRNGKLGNWVTDNLKRRITDRQQEVSIALEKMQDQQTRWSQMLPRLSARLFCHLTDEPESI